MGSPVSSPRSVSNPQLFGLAGSSFADCILQDISLASAVIPLLPAATSVEELVVVVVEASVEAVMALNAISVVR